MLKCLGIFALLLCSFDVPTSAAQLCQTTHQADLYCLIPAAFRTTVTPFSAFYTPFGTELSQLPIARPAGVILEMRNGQPVMANESLGPIFANRAETIGNGHLFLGGTLQYFDFNRIDGTDLEALPILLTYPASTGTVYTATMNRFDITALQYTFMAAYGITDRLDVSATIPIERIGMSVFVNGTEYAPGAAPATFTENAPGSSSGLGDIIVGGKFTFVDREFLSAAGGLDVRIPSGDELNFLGSGALGVRPYISVSKHGKFSPHLNLGYQWNGNSMLNPTADGQKQQLPTDFSYAIGGDFTARQTITVVVDLLGRYIFNSPRLTPPTPHSFYNVTAQSVGTATSSYLRNDLSIGVKGKVSSSLVFTGNVLVKLNNGGLRASAVPLFGVSYTFPAAR